jgi:BioD-like phosphotransacetylase family protein
MLNMALFEKEGVEVIGVIVNKVRPEKYNKINKLVREGFRKKGLEVLGVMPYRPILTKPTIQQILDELKIKLLCGESKLKESASHIIVAAMEPHEALKYVKDKSLVITPGDREDILLSMISSHLAGAANGTRISGIVLSGGIMPHKTVLDLMKTANIPVLLAKEDTYRVAACIHDLTVKIRPEDKEKIKLVGEMVEEYVDIHRILEKI